MNIINILAKYPLALGLIALVALLVVGYAQDAIASVEKEIGSFSITETVKNNRTINSPFGR